MQYGVHQIIDSRKLSLNIGVRWLLIWISFVIPVFLPSLFILWFLILLAIIIIEIKEDPIHIREGIYSTRHQNLFSIKWPNCIELLKPHTCDLQWIQSDERYQIHLFLPQSFSPHSIILKSDGVSKNAMFHFTGKSKGTFSDVIIYLKIVSKFKLFYFNYPIYHRISIKVIPPILTLSHQIQIIGNGYENHLSKFLGGESEFHGMKPYQVGDSFRSINWKKSSINLSELYANTYEKEQHRDTLILVNTGMASMFSYKNYSYMDYQLSLVYILSKVFLNNNDRVGLLTFSNQVDHYIAPELSHSQLRNIFTVLSNIEESYESMEFFDLYLFLQNKLKKNTILIMLSPFLSYKQLYIQKDILYQIGLQHQIIWLNPKRFHTESVPPKDTPLYLWKQAWSLLDNLEQQRFFERYKFKLVSEVPDKLYQETLKNYYALKW